MHGACCKNGYPNALASIGVFFQENSKFNISKIVAIPDNQKITTELYAVIILLQSVRIRERQVKVMQASMPNNQSTIHGMIHFRLIVGTDSSYLVNALCAHFAKWKLRPSGLLKTSVVLSSKIPNSFKFSREFKI